MAKMCKILFFFLLLFSSSSFLMAQVGINTKEPDTSAYLDITGSEKGLLLPRLSNADRQTLDGLGAVDGPANGLIIYNTTVGELQVNKGTKSDPNWVNLGSATTNDDVVWFYLPVTPISMTSSETQTIDLYTIYNDQLAQPLGLTYTQSQIEFIILGYDVDAFDGAPTIIVDPTSATQYKTILQYKAFPANVTDATFLNIVIKINK